MIDLGEGYVIDVDELNCTFGKLVPKSKDSDEVTVRAIAYLRSLDGALDYARRYFRRKALIGKETLITVNKAIDIIKESDAAFDKRMDVLR